MINGKLKSQVDQLWEAFWTGGVTNPLTVIEQITYLLFARLLDEREDGIERLAKRGKASIFQKIFTPTTQGLRWKKIVSLGKGEAQLKVVRDELFPFLRELDSKRDKQQKQAGELAMAQFLKHANCQIQTGNLMQKAIDMVNGLDLRGDTKGDLYEYLLSKLTTAGINGQFRTPRHIIDAMVEMIDPQLDQKILDPACGTGGFLTQALGYIKRVNSSKEGTYTEKDEEGTEFTIHTGDKIKPKQWEFIRNKMFTGFDFDSTMLRVATMNLLLHGIDQPDILYQDTLSRSFSDNFPKQHKEHFNIVLANPPFKGSVDKATIAKDLTDEVDTKKTELLFLILMLRMLDIGGKAAVIVPDGVLFGSSRAHRRTREILMDENQLEAVISLPSGVFKPYAGVSTAILLFTKSGVAEEVFFYKVEADGYSLDDKRNEVKENDLPDLLKEYSAWKKRKKSLKRWEDRTQKAFFVPADEIRGNKYDLSINRYAEEVYEEEEYEDPKVIIGQMRALEREIAADLDALEGMLG